MWSMVDKASRDWISVQHNKSPGYFLKKYFPLWLHLLFVVKVHIEFKNWVGQFSNLINEGEKIQQKPTKTVLRPNTQWFRNFFHEFFFHFSFWNEFWSLEFEFEFILGILIDYWNFYSENNNKRFDHKPAKNFTPSIE